MISVALATYNGARFLEQQLESILAQTVLPDEIVVSDDSSEDGTLEIVHRFQQGSKTRFVVMRNSARVGFAKNFERALRACSGDHIFLSDQDNIWYPHKVERQLETNPSALLVHSDAELVDENGVTLSTSYTASCKKNVYDNSFGRILCDNPVSGCTTMIRRELLSSPIGFPEWMPHDQWLALLAADKGKLSYDPERLIAFRQHANNVLGAGAPREKRARISLKERAGYHEKKGLMLQKTLEVAEGVVAAKNARIIADVAQYHLCLGKRRDPLKAELLYLRYSKYIDFLGPWTLRLMKCFATPFRLA